MKKLFLTMVAYQLIVSFAYGEGGSGGATDNPCSEPITSDNIDKECIAKAEKFLKIYYSAQSFKDAQLNYGTSCRGRNLGDPTLFYYYFVVQIPGVGFGSNGPVQIMRSAQMPLPEIGPLASTCFKGRYFGQ